MFSEDIYFHAGVKAIVEKECGLSVKLVTIGTVMTICKNRFIGRGDIFLVATGGFNMTMSALVMLACFSGRVFLLPNDRNTLKNMCFFSSLLPSRVGDDYIKDIIKGNVVSTFPKTWQLTYKESTVLSYRLQGMEVHNLSRLLAVSIKTIYAHQKNALKKMGVKSVAHLHTL